MSKIPVFQLMSNIRAPIFIALFSTLVFAVPDQIRELYEIYSQDIASLASNKLTTHDDLFGRRIIQAATMCIGIAILVSSIFYCSISILQKQKYDYKMVFILVLFFTSLPFIFFLRGFLLGSYGLVPSMIISLIFILIALRFYGNNKSLIDITRPTVFAVVTCFLLSWVIIGTFFPVRVAQYVGSLAVICLFLSFLTYYLSVGTIVYDRNGYPVISFAILIAVLFAVLNLNDNHRVRFSMQQRTPIALDKGFEAWLMNRKDRDYYAERNIPYPIYFISAEGGGLYAAFHAAAFLAKVQDICPNFAQHIFGISSVSGGSLGASVFAAQANTRAENRAWVQCSVSRAGGDYSMQAKRYFENDFLTPLVIAGLFPDFLQRFLPYPIPELDRARALEEAFVAAWSSVNDRFGAIGANNQFGNPINEMWYPDGATPALFLNTTSMATGSRITISPLFFEATPTALHVSDVFRNPCKNEATQVVEMSLATTVSLSARAPLITPVGYLDRKPRSTKCEERDFGNRLYLADGGYFENSGLETAWELVSRLRTFSSDEIRRVFPNGFEVKLIIIFTRDQFSDRWWSTGGDLVNSGQGELLSFIITLNNTRKARTRAVHSRLIAFDDNFIKRSDIEKNKIYNVILHTTLPLGWHLSQRSLEQIQSDVLLESIRIALDLAGSTSGFKSDIRN